MKPSLALWLAAAMLTGCASPPTLEGLQAILAPQKRAAKASAAAELPSVALPAPEGLRAISGELRAIPLQWDPLLLSGVAGYEVERAEQREGPFAPVASLDGRSSTAWVDRNPGLVAAAAPGARAPIGDGETFFYRVRPRTQGGALGAEASEVVAGTTAPPPDAPDELRAYSHQPRNVPLSWRASQDPTVAGYVIERGPTSRGPFEKIASLDDRFATVYVDTNLGDLRVFHYRVTSINRAGGSGVPSKPVRAVTKAEPLPPIGLRVVAQGLGVNELAWDPNVETDLIGYQLLRRRSGSERFELVAALDGQTTRAVDAQLGSGELVEYALRAVDGDGLESETGAPVAVASRDYELTATPRPEGVLLRWNPREKEGWVRARVYALGALGPTELGTASGGSFVDGEAKPGSRVRYQVVLERGDGRRAPASQPLTVDVPAR